MKYQLQLFKCKGKKGIEISNKLNISTLLSVIILSITLIVCTLILTINKSDNNQSKEIQKQHSFENDVMTLKEASEYLKIEEDEVLKIINIEKAHLSKTGSFNGMMFPYYKVDDKYYIYTNRLNEWLNDVSLERRVYDFNTLRKYTDH